MPETFKVDEKMFFHRLSDDKFLDMMAECKGYATTAGFESVCEAMYMQKPVLMIPAHIEQECNAIDAVSVGAGVASDSFDLSQLLYFAEKYKANDEFRKWSMKAEEIFLKELQ
jgi:uncharacterized protein (TIGR00661 family)